MNLLDRLLKKLGLMRIGKARSVIPVISDDLHMYIQYKENGVTFIGVAYAFWTIFCFGLLVLEIFWPQTKQHDEETDFIHIPITTIMTLTDDQKQSEENKPLDGK